MRKCGYAEFVDPRTGQVSYARHLRPGMLYPRFHVYVEVNDAGLGLNLHLDQKHPSYKGVHAHAGEYDGPVVEVEGARLKGLVQEIVK